MSELAITFLCPLVLEEKLLDLLLMNADANVFTSTATAAHGMAHEELDQVELVLGRARATSVQVIFAASEKDPRAAREKVNELLAGVRREFKGSGLRYWLTPILESGEII